VSKKNLLAEDAANYFFPLNSMWTSLTEVRLNDANGQSAGNIDIVLTCYDDLGKLQTLVPLKYRAYIFPEMSGDLLNNISETLPKMPIWTGRWNKNIFELRKVRTVYTKYLTVTSGINFEN